MTEPNSVAPRGAKPPVKLDRAALERVLARAAELQSTISAETPAVISEDEIVAIGREVGLTPEHLRQALAEERTRVVLVEEHGFVARNFGPGYAVASRVVPGKPEQILDTLNRWLTKEQTLTVKRRFADRMTWEAKGGLEGAIRRVIGGREIILVRATEVGASVTAIDPNRTLVRLDARVVENRQEMVGWSAAATGVLGLKGVAIAGIAWLFPPLAIALIGTAIGAAVVGGGAAVGLAIARSQRRSVERIQLALDQLIDRLEAGERPTPSLLAAFSEAARHL